MLKELQTSSSDQARTFGLSFKYAISPTDPEAPLAILVHGRAGNFDVMSMFRHALPATTSVVLPQAPCADPIGGYSWWQISVDHADISKNAEGAADTLIQFVQNALREYQLKPKICLAFGFSQGAATLSMVLQKRPELFAGIALLAGFVVKIPNHSNLQVTQPLPKVFIGHGTKDQTVSIERARQGAEYLKALGAEVTMNEDPVGHKVGSESMRLLRLWASGIIQA